MNDPVTDRCQAALVARMSAKPRLNRGNRVIVCARVDARVDQHSAFGVLDLKPRGQADPIQFAVRAARANDRLRCRRSKT